MDKIDRKFVICLIAMSMIVAKMFFLNNIFLIIGVSIFGLGIILDKVENKPIYLFFSLPLIYVMKFSNNQISMFSIITILYIVIMLYECVRKKAKINMMALIGIVCLLLLVFVQFLTNNNFNIFSSLGWIMNLLVLSLMISNIKEKKTIIQYINAFAISVAIVGILGIVFMNRTNIGYYLENMRRTNTISTSIGLSYRFCGFDKDPNYFSLQVLIAFWCVVIIGKSNKKMNYVLPTILVVIGLLTISKMYIIALAITTGIYSIFLLKKIKNIKMKNIFIFVCIIVILLYFGGNYINSIFIARFKDIDSIESMTTGRSSIWESYLDYISNNVKVLMIGEGIGAEFLNGHASHSSYILLLYRFGIIGLILLTIIFILIIKGNKYKPKYKIFTIYSVPLMALIITGFALDIVDFDSFIYLLLMVLGMYSLEEDSKIEEKNI